MTVYEYNNNEKAGKRFTHLITITHEDLTEATANTAQTIQMLSLPIGGVVKSAAFYLTTPFENTADNTLNTTTLIVGDGSSTARYIASKELNLNGSEVIAWASPNSVDTFPYAYLTADTVDAVFGSMAAKSLVNLNNGEVKIYLEVSSLA